MRVDIENNEVLDLIRKGLRIWKKDVLKVPSKALLHFSEKKNYDFPPLETGSLIIVGLDGMDKHFVKEFEMDYLQKLVWNEYSKEWYCDTIPHTAPSWTTIYTGVSPEVHNIYEFHTIVDGEEWSTASNRDGARLNKRSDINFPLLWEVLDSKGYDISVFGVPCVLPSLSYNAPRGENFIPASSEMIWKHYEEVINWIYSEQGKDRDVIISHFDVPDKINHKLDAGKLSILEAKPMADYLDSFLKFLAENFDKWVFLSDHGKPGSYVDMPEKKVRIPGHYREGLIVTNVEDPPMIMSNFSNWFGEVLKDDR